jgi:hypothetical protein
VSDTQPGRLQLAHRSPAVRGRDRRVDRESLPLYPRNHIVRQLHPLERPTLEDRAVGDDGGGLVHRRKSVNAEGSAHASCFALLVRLAFSAAGLSD